MRFPGYTGGRKQMIGADGGRQDPDHIERAAFPLGLTLNAKHVPEMKMHGLLERAPVSAPSASSRRGDRAGAALSRGPGSVQRSKRSIGPSSTIMRDSRSSQVVPLEESAKLARIDCNGSSPQRRHEAFRLRHPRAERMSIWSRCSTISARAPRAPPSRTLGPPMMLRLTRPSRRKPRQRCLPGFWFVRSQANQSRISIAVSVG